MLYKYLFLIKKKLNTDDNEKIAWMHAISHRTDSK